MEEREIDLIDLIADILSHWRGVLVCMLIGALLMGGFSYVRSYQSAKEVLVEEMTPEEEITPDKRLTELEEQLKASEVMAVRTVIDDEQEYVQYQQYIENSVLMQADPYNISRIEMLFKIQMDDMGQSYMLRSVYEDLVNGVGMLQWVEEQTGISAVSADELITAQAKSNVYVLNGGQETELGNDSLKVIILHSDEAECEKMARAVKDYIKQQHELLAQELGAHEVVLLSETAGTVMDTGLRDRQISYSNTKMTLLTNCAKAKEAFTENQQVYYELLRGEDGILEEDKEGGETEAEVETVAQRPSISKKYVVVGAVLFAFVYAGVFFVLYILNGKLRAADELQKLYHISQLGLIVKDEGKKKFFIDRWIDALRNRNKRQFTGEQSLELAATAVKISAKKQELDTICLMGCDLKAGAETVCRKLKEMLEQENISVMVLDNVLYDAEAMEKLGGAKGVVLVEKAASTMYDEITRELELVSRQGIKILGGIVVE
ncbi:MAG: hypothetical protein ACI4AB_12990 [Acetatifactor sp.]